MDLEWHDRLISRLIKTNPDATIKDYWYIVDPEVSLDEIENPPPPPLPQKQRYVAPMKSQVYGPGYDQIAFEHYRKGGDCRTLALEIGIMTSTVYAWRQKHKSFKEAIIQGKFARNRELNKLFSEMN